MCEQGIVNTKRADLPPKECSSLEEVLQYVSPGGSVIISGPNENSQKARIMIRTGSQMENKKHENVSKKVARPKEHTG